VTWICIWKRRWLPWGLILIMLSDFMQVLKSRREHTTKNEYFSMNILFNTIYLLQKYKLNPNKYYDQEINMSNFVDASEHDVHMYAKFGDLIFYGCL
jgi:hypothetical protein